MHICTVNEAGEITDPVMFTLTVQQREVIEDGAPQLHLSVVTDPPNALAELEPGKAYLVVVTGVSRN